MPEPGIPFDRVQSWGLILGLRGASSFPVSVILIFKSHPLLCFKVLVFLRPTLPLKEYSMLSSPGSLGSKDLVITQPTHSEPGDPGAAELQALSKPFRFSPVI